MKRLVLLVCLTFATLFQASMVPVSAQSGYTLTEIGAGYLVSGMNSLGEVVGWGGQGWFVWGREAGVVLDVPLSSVPAYTGGFWFGPNRLSINAAGVVAGAGLPPNAACTHPAVRTTDGTWSLLPNFGANGCGVVAAINDSGQMVGVSQGGGFNTYGPFIGTSPAGIQTLSGIEPDAAYTTHGVAYDISNAGYVTGYCGGNGCSDGNWYYSAFVWSASTGKEVMVAGSSTRYAFGHAVNDAGVVVGEIRDFNSTTGDTDYRVFRWSGETGVEDLDAPTGAPERLDINNAGDIILTLILPSGGYRAYLYHNGTWTPLRDLVNDGFLPDYAVGVTDDGVIGGWGRRDGIPTGFVLTPNVPTDTTAPVITVPENVIADPTEAAGASVSFLAQATDDVDGDVPVSCLPASGALFPIGTTTVTCSATDNAGNPASASFTITVREPAAPQIDAIVPSQRSLWPANHQMVRLTAAVTARDAFGGTPVCEITGISSNEPVNGDGDGDTAPDWTLLGGLQFDVRAERAKTGTGRVYTVVVTCLDARGSSAVGSTNVLVPRTRAK